MNIFLVVEYVNYVIQTVMNVINNLQIVHPVIVRTFFIIIIAI